ncbi:PAS-domain containing protein [Vibrio lentus]|nr:PAS-domain containing protein [Vibrio lentus]
MISGWPTYFRCDRHNAEQGLCGPGDPEDHVRRRVYHLEQGTRHTSSRIRPDGRVI